MILEKIRILTQLQTLAWTIPMLVLCFIVLWEIRKTIKSSCIDIKEKKTQMCWILLGIFFAFFGKIGESAFWAVPWTLAYLDHPSWLSVNDLGVYFNAVFRQGFFTIAAYCHLRAFISPENEKKEKNSLKTIHWILGISFIIGQAYMIILLWIKPLN